MPKNLCLARISLPGQVCLIHKAHSTAAIALLHRPRVTDAGLELVAVREPPRALGASVTLSATLAPFCSAL
jgi:hypothetical protein